MVTTFNIEDSRTTAAATSSRATDVSEMVDVMDKLRYEPLPFGSTAHDRFPGATPGVEMLSKINKCYRVATGVTIQFLNEKGLPGKSSDLV